MSNIKKGQNLRVFIGDKVVAYATSCTVALNANLSANDESSKDSPDAGEWETHEVTSRSWTVSCDALYAVKDIDGATVAGELFDDIKAAIGTKVAVSLETTTGTDHRTKGTTPVIKGDMYVASINLTAANKQNSTYSVNFTGDGSPDGLED